MHKSPSTHTKIRGKNRLQKTPNISQISDRRPEPLVGSGQGRSTKCNYSDTQTPSGAAVTTVTELEMLLDTCTDTQFAKVIQDLPATWQSHNLKGDNITKRMLKKTSWGAYRDDHNILAFQHAILSTKPHPQTITQYDTQMAQSSVQHNDAWTRRINNPLIDTQLLHPLQNSITMIQVYHAQHYTTLITDNNKYYYYDILSLTTSPTHCTKPTHSP